MKDRRPTLLSILRSMLVTYSKLMNALLAPPQTAPSEEVQQEWQRYVEWITVLSQNIMAAANDLRPVQVSYHCIRRVLFDRFAGEDELGAANDETAAAEKGGDRSFAFVRTRIYHFIDAYILL